MTPEEPPTRTERFRVKLRDRAVWVIEEAEAVIREAQGLPPYAFDRPTPPPPLR